MFILLIYFGLETENVKKLLPVISSKTRQPKLQTSRALPTVFVRIISGARSPSGVMILSGGSSKK
jgi:hypothetical protein